MRAFLILCYKFPLCRTMLFTLNHGMTGTQMDGKIIASIEDFEIQLALLGSHAHGQTRLLVSVDLTDAETLTGQLNIINRSQEKQFHLTTARGNDESSVKVHFARNEDGFSSQVDFRTLSSLPQVTAITSSHFSTCIQHNYDLIFWYSSMWTYSIRLMLS